MNEIKRAQREGIREALARKHGEEGLSEEPAARRRLEG